MRKIIFSAISSIVDKGWFVLIALWIAAAAWLYVESPRFSDVSSSTESNFLPPESDSVKAKELLDKYFPSDSFSSRAVISIERDGMLNERDFEFIDQLTAWLQKDSGLAAIAKVVSVSNSPLIKHKLVSKNGRASLIIVNLKTVFISKESQRTIAAISDKIKQHPPGTEIAVTGDAGLGRDYQLAIDLSLKSTTKVTLVLLIIILLIVFKSPITPIIPLATIGVSFSISRSIVSFIAQSGVSISPLTEIFLIVVLFGVGTDYCIFLIARYKEELEKGAAPRDAVKLAVEKVGESISSSAFTVVIGLGFMCLAKFGPFSKTGPCVAMGVAISLLAALTLAPSLILLMHSFLFWPFKVKHGNFEHKGWVALAKAVTNYPLMVLIALLLCFAPFVWYGFKMNRSFDLFGELPDSSQSVRGLNIIKSNFKSGELSPLTVVVKTESELWQPASIDKIYQLTKALEGIESVSEVRSAVQPAGDIAWIEKALLPNRFPLYTGGLKQGMNGLSEIHKGLDKSIDGLKLFRSNIEKQSQPAQFIFIKVEPDQRYEEARKKIAAFEEALNKMSEGVLKVNSGIGTVSESMKALFNPQGEFAYIFDHFVLPDNIFTEKPELKNAMSNYISEDGKSMKLSLILNTETFSDKEKTAIDEIKRVLAIELGRLKFKGPEYHLAGASATIYDEREVTKADFYRIVFFVLAGVFVILLFLLWELAESIYLILTMLLSYFTTLGVSTLIFQVYLGKAGIDWKVQFFMFVILVALGVDYNIFLMTRIKEERHSHETKEAVKLAVVRTGEIISYCGLIMAGTFVALMTSPLYAMIELGFALVCGILLDTFVVRPMLVPAIIVLLDRARMRYVKEGVGR